LIEISNTFPFFYTSLRLNLEFSFFRFPSNARMSDSEPSSPRGNDTVALLERHMSSLEDFFGVLVRHLNSSVEATNRLIKILESLPEKITSSPQVFLFPLSFSFILLLGGESGGSKFFSGLRLSGN
jgi:hypothetical protein